MTKFQKQFLLKCLELTDNIKEITKDINEATTSLLNYYVPLITAETESNKRLASVKKNITQIKSQINIEPEPLPVFKPMDSSIENNPYTFFSAIAMGAGLIAATVFAITR